MKVDKDNNPLGGAEFTLIHDETDDGNGVYCCTQNVNDMVAASRAADGHLIFSSIPSGHTYFLRETYTPAGYVTLPDHQVKVEKGVAAIYEIDGTTPHEKAADGHTYFINNPAYALEFVGSKQLVGRSLQPGEFKFQLFSSPAAKP